MERRRVVEVDAQGFDEVMKIVDRANKEIREAEEEIAEKTGQKPPVAQRIVVLPASAAQVAEAKAQKARDRGNPPL
jgi:cell division septum initiation protein DivIVA